MKKNNSDTVLQEIKVTEKSELLSYLIDQKVRKSRNAIKSLLVHKQIKVNGKTVTQHDHALKTGDSVTINKYNKKFTQKKLKGVTIIYEDKDLLVIDKEPGLLSVSTGTAQLKETAYNIVNTYIKEKNAKTQAYILYRLDRETSGLMLFAKTKEMQEDLQQDWVLHPPKRTYQAIVEGKMSPAKGTITSWLTENKNFLMFSSTTDNGGLKSVLHYKTLEHNNRFALLMIDIETARKNQIRVQLQSVGHPILGDKKYGAKNNSLKRIALHADTLSFNHPETRVRMEFSSPLPKKMQLLVDTFNNTPHTPKKNTEE